MKGIVKALKKDHGFGFIKDENGQDRFFHANHLEGVKFDVVREGDAVEFEPYTEDGKGERARQVRLIL